MPHSLDVSRLDEVYDKILAAADVGDIELSPAEEDFVENTNEQRHRRDLSDAQLSWLERIYLRTP